MATPTIPATSPRALQDVIARIESSSNPFALRFEPTVYAGDVAPSVAARIATLHGADYETGRVIAATSWGLFQIMGFNLWGGPHAYAGTLYEFCADTIAQRLAFETFLADRGMNFTLAELLGNANKLIAFAAAYNGDGIRYARAMRESAAVLGYSS